MTDEESRRLARLKALRDSYRRVFASEDGKAIWDDMAKAHYMTSSTFSPEPLELARREGERNVLLRIWSILNSSEVENAGS